MKIQFVRPKKPPLLVGQSPDIAPAANENLDFGVQLFMQGALTVVVIAPDDDQKLFKLVPEEARPDLLRKAWAQETIGVLQNAVNKVLGQALMQARVHPMSNVVQPGHAVDASGRLVYTFQVVVQTHPPAPLAQVPNQAPTPPSESSQQG